MCTWVCVLDSLHHTYYSQSVLGSVKMEGHALSQLAHVTVQMATVGTTVEVSLIIVLPAINYWICFCNVMIITAHSFM